MRKERWGRPALHRLKGEEVISFGTSLGVVWAEIQGRGNPGEVNFEESPVSPTWISAEDNLILYRKKALKEPFALIHELAHLVGDEGRAASADELATICAFEWAATMYLGGSLQGWVQWRRSTGNDTLTTLREGVVKHLEPLYDLLRVSCLRDFVYHITALKLTEREILVRGDYTKYERYAPIWQWRTL